MKNETIFRSCKKITASFMAAMMLLGTGNITADVFAKAEETAAGQYATGCLPTSEEVLKANEATDVEIYDLECISADDETTYDALADVCKAAAIASSDLTVDLTNEFPTPGNQGEQGSCVAWAVGYALKSHQEYVEHGWDFDSTTTYSPSYIYNQICIGDDSGSTVDDAMRLVVDEGVCSLYNMGYDDSDYKTAPNASQKDKASNYKATSWRSISGLENVKAILDDGNGVVISIRCYPDFDDISESNETYDVINSGDTSRGGHAICLIGYDDVNSRFKFMNSWGTDWGLGGYGYISYEMFEDSRNSNGWGYTFIDESHNDSTVFYTSNPEYVTAAADIRTYSNSDYYSVNGDSYHHSINEGTLIKIADFDNSGLHPYFVTSDGYYINAQKSLLEEAESNEISNILINGNSVSADSVSNSESSTISFASSSDVKYNNHGAMKIDYTVNQSDSYNGYAGAKIKGDSTVSTSGATGIGFWYMTPEGVDGTIAFCMQGSVAKKLVQLPTTNGEWVYYYNDYNFSGSSMSDIEIYINGNESNCVTTPSSGTLYIAELAATNITSQNSETPTYYTFSATAGTQGKVTGKNNGTYIKGTSVTVTVEPAADYYFVGWWTNAEFNGDAVSTDTTYTFTLSENIALYAKFAEKDSYTFNVIAGEGGYVSGTANGTIKAGTQISVSAVAYAGYVFAGWSKTEGGEYISTNSTYSFAISENTTLYANFEKNTEAIYTVTVVTGTGCDRIAAFGSGYSGGTFTSADFEQDVNLSLLAMAKSGYEFVGWWTNPEFTGDPIHTNYVYSFKVSESITLYPKFEPITCTFTVTAGEGGTVGGSSSGSYESGEYILVSAQANDGYEFVGWSNTQGGEIIQTHYVYSFNISEDTTLYANFEKIPEYTVTVVKTEGCASISGTNITNRTFLPNDTVTVIARAESGYTFAGWWTNAEFSGDPVSTLTNYTFQVTADTTLYPKFESEAEDEDETDSDIFITGISNSISDWTNANSGSYLNITSGSNDYLFNGLSALKLEYCINTNDQYGGYAGRTVSLESTYSNSGNYDGIGFWYLTPEEFDGQIALCLQSQSAGLDDLVQLPATNGEWTYYFYETSKINVSDMTLYINGSKNGYTTTLTSGDIAEGTLYIANMSMAKE